MYKKDNPLTRILNNPHVWYFLLIFFGALLFCWAIWGGELKILPGVKGPEAGLGLNPPPLN